MGKALIFVALLALAVYMTIRYVEKRRGGPVARGPKSPPPRRRAIAPDDDPEFLRDLEQKRRRERREQDEHHGEPDST